MIDWAQIRAESRHDFTFKNLTGCHVILKRWGSYLSFTDENYTTYRYILRGFPTFLPEPEGIEVVFDIKRFNLSGEEIPLMPGEGITYYHYQEPEAMVDLFAGFNPPQGLASFGLQQAINGLTRRLETFEGHPQFQTGHRIYNFVGNALQPVTFTITDIVQTTNGEDNGSFVLDVLDGIGPFEYVLVTQQEANQNLSPTGGYGIDTYQFVAITDPVTVEDLAAGQYVVFVKDSTGEFHFKSIVIESESTELWGQE